MTPEEEAAAKIIADAKKAADAEAATQERASNGRFAAKSKEDIDALKAEIAELKKGAPEKPKTTSIKASKYEERFAEKLKAELGDKYDKELETIPIGQRIDTMEAIIKALKGKIDPLEKGGTEGDVGGTPPPVDNKPKTFLQRQKEAGYRELLRDKGSYSTVAQKLYGKK